jgi:hypothetical protein
VLIPILMLSLTAFSQIDTNNQPTKCFPIPLVKKITKDLISGDSAKAQLILVEQQLSETINKSIKQDSIINLLMVKDTNNQIIIGAQDEKYSILENHTKKVELNLKKEKVKTKITSYLSGTILAILIYVIIVK